MEPEFQVSIYNDIVQIPQNINDLKSNYCLKKLLNNKWLLKPIEEEDDVNSEYVSGGKLIFLMKNAVNSNWTDIETIFFERDLIVLSSDPYFQHFGRLIPGIEDLKTKLKRSVRKAAKMGRGLIRMEERGIVGKIISDSYLIEGATRDHIYGADHFFMKWKETPTHLNFEDWMTLEHPNADVSKVKYLTNDLDRERYKISFIEGRLHRNLFLFDTYRERTEHSGPGHAIFVIDSNEQFFAGSHVRGKFHHSSFVEGAAVMGAGEIQTNYLGEIISITNKSGHYKPDEKQILNTFRILEKNGINLNNVNFTKISKYGSILYDAKKYYDTNGNCPFIFKHFFFQIDPSGSCIFTLMKLVNSGELIDELNGNVEFLKKHFNFQKFIFQEKLLSGLLVEYPMNEYLFSKGNMLPEKWEGGSLFYENDYLANIEFNPLNLESWDLDFLQFLDYKGVYLINVKASKNGVNFNAQKYLDSLLIPSFS